MVTIEQVVEIINSTGVVEDMSKYENKKSFKENGIDSLDIFTVFLAIQERFGIEFTEEDSINIKSALEMVDSINSKL